MDKLLLFLSGLIMILFVVGVIITGGLLIYIGFLVFSHWGIIGLLIYIWFMIAISTN